MRNVNQHSVSFQLPNCQLLTKAKIEMIKKRL